MNFTKFPHSAMFVDATNVCKTEYVLRILETEYKNNFEFIVIMCPTILDNKRHIFLGGGFLMIRTFLLCVTWKESQVNGLNYLEIH